MSDKPRPPGTSRLSVTEINAARAPHSRPPPPPFDERNTVPPPAPDKRGPPRGYEAARRPLQSVDDSWDGPKTPSVRDSQEITTDALLAELAAKANEARAAKAEAEALRKALEAAKRATVIAAPVPPADDDVRAKWHSGGLKLLGALTVLAAAAATYLSVHTTATVPPRVENTEIRQRATEAVTDSDHSMIVAVRDYLRAEQQWRDCVFGQMGSALKRGTGHRVSDALDAAEWIETSLPTRRPALLWDRAIWYPASPCAAEPKAP